MMHQNGESCFMTSKTRWWFQIFFVFTPICREMIQFDFRIFFRWFNEKPPTRKGGSTGFYFIGVPAGSSPRGWREWSFGWHESQPKPGWMPICQHLGRGFVSQSIPAPSSRGASYTLIRWWIDKSVTEQGGTQTGRSRYCIFIYIVDLLYVYGFVDIFIQRPNKCQIWRFAWGSPAEPSRRNVPQQPKMAKSLKLDRTPQKERFLSHFPPFSSILFYRFLQFLKRLWHDYGILREVNQLVDVFFRFMVRYTA